MDKHSGKLENQSFNLSWTGFAFSKTIERPLSPASATMKILSQQRLRGGEEIELSSNREEYDSGLKPDLEIDYSGSYLLILVVFTVKRVSSKSAKISDNEIM